MTTHPVKREHVKKRLEAEQARVARVKKQNEEYYQHESEWKMPRYHQRFTPR